MTASDKKISELSGGLDINSQAEFITDLIDRSFRGGRVQGAARTGRARSFLRGILEHFGAEGIVFWRLEGPEYKGKTEQPHRLVSGVSVFSERREMPQRLELRNLPIESTNSGTAFSNMTEVFGCDKDSTCPDPDNYLPFEIYENDCFKKRKIHWMLALPIASPETAVNGVLSLYWRDDQKQHVTNSDQSFFDIAAALWPGVYQRIRESRRLQLITTVDLILGETGHGISQESDLTPLSSNAADKIMEKICLNIGDLLHAEEVSIFLTPLNSSEEKWSCRATNWYQKPTRIYTPDALPGITGWCLAQKSAIYIPDLHSFDTDKEWLKSLMSGDIQKLEWQDDLGLKEWDKVMPEPPVRSFLAAPLIVEGVLVGVIRCSSQANSPLIYFSNEDRTSLEIVGTRIAQTWLNWQIAHAKNEQAKGWHLFNEYSREIPNILSKAIHQQPPNFSLLQKSVIHACQKCLAAWGQCDLKESPTGFESEGTTHGIEIAFTENYTGALDASPAHGITEMAKRQLEVYRVVCDLMMEVRTDTTALHRRALIDMRHQIINPLNKALLATNRHLKTSDDSNMIKMALNPIRALLKKSINVANAFHLLVELEKNTKIRIESTPLNPQKLYMLLAEVVQDARLDLDISRNLKITLKENITATTVKPDKLETSSYPTARPALKADLKLLEQVLNSVIENAVKYSKANQEILLDVQLSAAAMTVVVTSRGVKLLPEEAARVAERNYRSPTAIRYVGEGTGIGLFLVDAIAKAHRGSFYMTPTDLQGFTSAIFQIPAT